jgi:hypothetical protein
MLLDRNLCMVAQRALGVKQSAGRRRNRLHSCWLGPDHSTEDLCEWRALGMLNKIGSMPNRGRHQPY